MERKNAFDWGDSDTSKEKEAIPRELMAKRTIYGRIGSENLDVLADLYSDSYDGNSLTFSSHYLIFPVLCTAIEENQLELGLNGKEGVLDAQIKSLIEATSEIQTDSQAEEKMGIELTNVDSRARIILDSYGSFQNFEAVQSEEFQRLKKISEILPYADSTSISKGLSNVLEHGLGLKNLDGILKQGLNRFGIQDEVSNAYLTELKEIGMKFVKGKALYIRDETDEIRKILLDDRFKMT